MASLISRLEKLEKFGNNECKDCKRGDCLGCPLTAGQALTLDKSVIDLIE